MSLSLAIKNTILILLILLIAHFLIKNFLLNCNHNRKIPDKKPEIINNSNNINENAHPYPFHHTLSETANVAQDVGKCDIDNQNKNELLQYVFDDNKDTLNKYFDDNIVSGEVKDLECSIKKQQDVCKTKDDQHIPLSTTCDGSIDVTNFKSGDKKIKEDNLLEQEKWGTLLNKYENENEMNSDTLYDGDIRAFNNSYDEWGTIYHE